MNKDRNKHGVYIPTDLWEQLKDFCEKHYNVSCSAAICRAIKDLIEMGKVERDFTMVVAFLLLGKERRRMTSKIEIFGC